MDKIEEKQLTIIALTSLMKARSALIKDMVDSDSWGSLANLLFTVFFDEKQNPTVWAYEQVCHANEEKRKRIETLEKLLAEEKAKPNLERQLLKGLLKAIEAAPDGRVWSPKSVAWLEGDIYPAVALAKRMMPS